MSVLSPVHWPHTTARSGHLESEPESEAFPALGDGAEEERRGDGWTPDSTLSQNNHIALLFYKLIQDDDLSALLIYLVKINVIVIPGLCLTLFSSSCANVR